MAASMHLRSFVSRTSRNSFNILYTKYVSHISVANFQRPTVLSCCYSTQSSAEEEIDAELERKRNKSRLKPWIRNEMSGSEMPSILFDFQTTVKYKRKLYAKFGRESGINPSIMWPSAKELKTKMEIENELEPNLMEMLENVELQKREEERKIRERELKVDQQMSKLSVWMKELHDRKAKKIAEVKAIRDKKERLVEEVRQYFGYKLSPKDPKFQEVLEKKEKEEKKAEKEAKKKEKMAKEMAQLASMAQQSLDDAQNKEPNNKSTPTDASKTKQ